MSRNTLLRVTQEYAEQLKMETEREREREIAREIEREVEKQIDTDVETDIEMEHDTGNETEIERGSDTEIEDGYETEIEREIERESERESETNIEKYIEKEIETESDTRVVAAPNLVAVTVRFECDGCGKRLKAKVPAGAATFRTKCSDCGKWLEKVPRDLQAKIATQFAPYSGLCHTPFFLNYITAWLSSISPPGQTCGSSECLRRERSPCGDAYAAAAATKAGGAAGATDA